MEYHTYALRESFEFKAFKPEILTVTPPDPIIVYFDTYEDALDVLAQVDLSSDAYDYARSIFRKYLYNLAGQSIVTIELCGVTNLDDGSRYFDEEDGYANYWKETTILEYLDPVYEDIENSMDIDEEIRKRSGKHEEDRA